MPSSSRIRRWVGGEGVEFDPTVGVGEVQALEGGEDVGAGGFAHPALGQERQSLVGLLVVGLERGAQLGFEEPEDQQRDPDDRDECVDAVVVVQKDRTDLEGLFEVAVAAFDDFLFFVEAQDLGGGQAAWEVGRQRVDPVGALGVGDGVLVALPGQRRLGRWRLRQ